MQQKIYDIIIAGAGPAGLTAAVYARRAGKSVLLIEKEAFGGQITLSPHVENSPFTRPMSGNELVEVLVEQVMNLGADVEVGAVAAVSENVALPAFHSVHGFMPKCVFNAVKTA